MLSDQKIAQAALSISENMKWKDENTRKFFERVYIGGLDKYKIRLKSLGFSNIGKVLDAGCGTGQWCFALSELENTVYGCDSGFDRIEAAQKMAAQIGANNTYFEQSTLEHLPYSDKEFDGLICYSVLYLTRFQEVISEFSRVLKSGGLLYLSTNDVGFFLHELIARPYKTPDFDSRVYALRTFANTLKGGASSPSLSNGANITFCKRIENLLKENGFDIVQIAEEGNTQGLNQPFCKGRFMGLLCTYDILARKK